VLEEVTHERGQAPRREGLAGRLELLERPPALLDDAFGCELVDRPFRRGFERIGRDEEDAFRLAAEAGEVGEPVLAPPEARAELEVPQARLLA
jgi:hypothetical protein